MRRGGSLVGRVVLGIIVAELLCVAALLAISVFHEYRVRLRAVDIALEGRADSLFGAIQDAEDPGDNIFLDPRELVLPRGDLFAVFDAGGRVLGSSPGTPAALSRSREAGLHTRQVEGRRFRVLQRNRLRVIDRPENGGVGLERPVTILYATPLDRLWRQVFEGIGFSLLASVALILLTTAVMVALMRRLLRPLEELAGATAAITPRDLQFRAPESALALRELQPLASTLSSVVDQLRQAFERQHRFLGDAAHELKTAVAVVRSSLQLMLLRSRAAGESAAATLEHVIRDNERVEELISRMLLLARLEERPETAAAQADLNTAAKISVERLLPIAARAEVTLTLQCCAAGYTAPGDSSEAAATCPCGTAAHRLPVRATPEDLEVLLSNLLLNAVQHSLPGGAVRLALHAADGSAVAQVVDRGEGIAPEALAHIFERFYRVDTSRARQTGGAGLGLSICKAIAETAGGRISVRSGPGEGTDVTVTLPLVDARA